MLMLNMCSHVSLLSSRSIVESLILNSRHDFYLSLINFWFMRLLSSFVAPGHKDAVDARTPFLMRALKSPKKPLR